MPKRKHTLDQMRKRHRQRSRRSQLQDERLKAPINPNRWWNDPSHYDVRGIDSPSKVRTQTNRKKHTKRRPQKKRKTKLSDLVPSFKKLAHESFEEGVEYHAEIYRHKGELHITEVRKGTAHQVKALPHRSRLLLKGAKKVGSFHTHPKATSKASFEDKMANLMGAGIGTNESYDVIVGAKDKKIRIHEITKKQMEETWFKKASNLSLRYMTGTYSRSRAEPMLERYTYQPKEKIIPID